RRHHNPQPKAVVTLLSAGPRSDHGPVERPRSQPHLPTLPSSFHPPRVSAVTGGAPAYGRAFRVLVIVFASTAFAVEAFGPSRAARRLPPAGGCRKGACGTRDTRHQHSGCLSRSG